MAVYRKNNGKYYCQFQINGERIHRLCVGATTIKEAEKIENALKYKLQQQQNGIIPREPKKIKLKTIIQLYDEYAKINKKSYGRDAFTKYIGEYFGRGTYTNEITIEKIEKFKEWLKTERESTNSTINKYLAALSKMFNLGINNKLLKENPVSKVKKFKEDNHRIRYLTKDEEKRLFKNIDELYPYLRPLVVCALQTGMRRGEIFKLKWSNIDFDYNFIELLETKSGKSRKIPISDTLMEILNKQSRTNEYVFINQETGKPYVDIKNSFHTVLEKANIENFKFHDLRHTVGTRLVEKGTPLPVVQELLGHAKISTTMRYVHSNSKQKQEAISILNSYN